MIEYESEVFAECGAWKNYLDLEDSLSLDELMELYAATMERQQRMLRMMAAAWGAEIEEPPSRHAKGGEDNSRPAWLIDPRQGGEATPLYGEQEVASLPIGLGYSIISEEL